MKVAGLFVVLLAACGMSSSGDDYPVIGGGGGIGGNTVPGGGGGGGGGDAGAPTARICLVKDPRNLRTNIGSCDTMHAGGLMVVADDGMTQASAITASDGTFSLDKPMGSVVWKVSGSNVITSFMADGYVGMSIPVITTADYTQMKSDNAVASLPETPNVGDLMVRVQHTNGDGAAGLTGFATPGGSYDTIYDAATGWTSTTFGANGTAWVPALAPGTETFTVDLGGGNSMAMNGLVVNEGAITFGQIILNP